MYDVGHQGESEGQEIGAEVEEGSGETVRNIVG